MKRREDGAVREVMKELLRSDLRFHKTDCGRFGAMTAWGLKDTSSRPAKDLGGTLRRTPRATLRSFDSPAKGGLHHAHYPGRVANRMDLLKWTSRAAAPVFAIMLCGSNSTRAAASQSQIPCADGLSVSAFM